MAQLIFAGTNLGLGESAAAQFHHSPLQLASTLAFEQIGRQLPVGRLGELGRYLPANVAALLILETALQVGSDGVAESGGRLETAQLAQKLFGQFGQIEFLDVQNFKLNRHFLAPQFFVGSAVAELDVDGSFVARRNTR